MFHWCCFVWFHVLLVLVRLISCFTGVVLFDFMFYWCWLGWFHVSRVLFCLISNKTTPVKHEINLTNTSKTWNQTKQHPWNMKSTFHVLLVLVRLISCFTGVVLFDFMFYWCLLGWFHVLQVLFCLISCFTDIAVKHEINLTNTSKTWNQTKQHQ
jgi:hypothetical protein